MSRTVPHSYKVYLPLLLLFAIVLATMPRTEKFNYAYKKGAPWMHETLVAQFDFPILKTDAQLREEMIAAGSSVIPYYKYSSAVADDAIGALERADFGQYAGLKREVGRIMSEVYSKGVFADNDEEVHPSSIIYIQKDKRASRYPVDEIYTVSDARTELLAGIRRYDSWVNADSLCRKTGIYEWLVPNLIFDKQTTELVHDEAIDYISPTSGVVNAGRLIVSNGEIITAEVEQLLDSYKAEYENSLGYNGPVALLWLGEGILTLLLVLMLFLTIYYTNYRIFYEFNRYCYLLLIFFLSSLTAFLIERTNPELVYLVPFSLFALYLSAFFKKRVVLPVYFVSMLPLLMFSHNGIELFVMYLVAGFTAVFSFSYFHKGWQQFLCALFVYISLLVTFAAFSLVDGVKGFNDYQTILYLGLGSLFSVAGYPLIYLFERVFMLVSNSRLIELSDTNNKLLRELAHKAPGTFQHSLQVMNMADAVARSIDANILLVRAGALYHDIGKTVNPQCFIENETPGVKYHDGLSAIESAREIIKHVSDGIALAEKNNLPEIVKAFIYTHHGTTCTAYFYNKYISEGGDPANADDFYYKGQKPTTKEQVIIMLCDTLEAASRTLKDYSQHSTSELVERIISAKISDGQFVEADISMRELDIVKKTLKEYLQQVHHARVAYPKRLSGRRK